MNKTRSLPRALITLSALLFAPANALALSDLDTRFSVQVHGRDRQLHCDFMTVSNGRLNCTDGKLVEQIPLSRIDQLNVVYMGKEFNVSEINESDKKSLNAMSMKKEKAFSKKRHVTAKNRKNSVSSKASLESSGEYGYRQVAGESKGSDDSNSYSDRLYEKEHNRLVAKLDSYCKKWRTCKGRNKVLYDKTYSALRLLESDPEQYFYNLSVRKAIRKNQAAAGSQGNVTKEWDTQDRHYTPASSGNITGEWDTQGRHYTPAGGGNAWRSDGVFMQKAAGGYINTQTGEFVPAN